MINNETNIYRRILCLLVIVSANVFFLVNYIVCNTLQDSTSVLDSALHFEIVGWENYLKGDYIQSEVSYIKSLALYKKILPIYHFKLGDLYLNLGLQNKKQWNYNEAINFYKQSESIYKENSNNRDIAIVYMNIGNILKNKEDFKNAEEYYQYSLSRINRGSIEDFIIKSSIYNNLGLLYQRTGEINEAISYFLISSELKSNYDPKSLSIPLNNVAICYFELEEYEKSLFYHKNAIDIMIKYKGENHMDLGYNYLHLGKLCIAMNNEEEGLAYYRKALKLYTHNNGKYHPAAYECFVLLGQYYFEKEDYNESLSNYQQALITLAKHFDNTDITSYPAWDDTYSKIKLLEVVKGKAQALYSYYNSSNEMRYLEITLEGYELALLLIEKIRGEYMSEESKLLLAEHQTEVYAGALKVAYQLAQETGDVKYNEMAFIIAEKGKAAILMDALRHNEARKFGGVPQVLLQNEADLKRSIAFYSEYLYEEKKLQQPDSAKVKLWEEKLFSLNRDYDELIALFNTNYPNYYTLKYNTDVMMPGDIQNYLSKDEALIEFSLHDSILYTFVITSNQYNLFRLGVDSLFYKAIDEIFVHTSNTYYSNVDSNDFKSYISSAYALYDKLITPVTEFIQNKRLIIIPDKKLSYVPFELLLTSSQTQSNKPDYRHLSYLIKDYSISYAYSATHLFEDVQNKKARRNKLLAFVPQYKNSDLEASLFRSYRQEYLDQLSPLPFALEEVKHIAGIIRETVVYRGEEATESNFKNIASQYDILHLAMHTIIDNTDPMFSKLAFEPANDSVNDGFLNTFEIYNQQIPASLVVLSSCSSGGGILREGEGVVSLARGFAYAGCPSIVMTLWEVDDKAGVKVMAGFYKYLKQGKHINDALRLSKLDYLETTDVLNSHPFLWAGYIGIGQNDPIYRTSIIIYIIPSVLVMFLITGIILQKKRRYNRAV